ncbi:hypothetical protein GCM10027589_21730 [Actinocorallia lasiicapitis]
MPRTPREVGKQVQEAVNEQVRDLPIHAARLAMFGVGRTLLLTDRVTKDYRDLKEGDLRLVLDRLKGDAEKLTGKVTGRLADTPVGRVLDLVVPKPAVPVPATPVAAPPAPAPEIVLGKPKPAPEPVVEPVAVAEPEPVVEPVAVAEPEPVVEPVAVAEPEPVVEPVAVVEPEPVVEPVTVEVELPVPNYDELTHASLRARLRKLSLDEVKILREYEASHAARAEIVKMYDNRIAKLSEQP